MGPDEKRMVSFQGKYIPLDEDGHLVNAGDWSEGLAGHLAALDGLEFAENHWQVIRFIREYYLRYESVPMPKVIIKGLNKQQGAEVYTIKHLYALFPHTPMRRACRYAGVPQPAGCS
jgi:tRNA 2-thiouridine synthesizing protein E